MSIESALDLIESVKDYKVLFVGDSIIDEYHYVASLGKSPKEHLIPMLYLEEEVFRGGVEAAANHARSFCSTVDLCRSPMETRKVRFVEKTYMRKLAEVHYQNGVPSRDNFLQDGYDVTVVADFGHGQVSGEMISELSKRPFLAVNAQTNSANIGFNLITKYPRADYIVIDEPEARLAAADRESHIEDVIQRLAHGRCSKFVVTLGNRGAIGYDGKFYRQESKTDLVRDTMGAGDAFFAVTAPMAKTGSMEDLLMIGCAAGAIKTQIVGHRESVTKEAVVAYLSR